MNFHIRQFFYWSMLVLYLPQLVLAETVTSDTVISLQKQGRHYEALIQYLEDPELSFLEKIHASRSAWALGLADEARNLSDELLEDERLTGIERAQVFLARAILEFQEGAYGVARAFAEDEVEILDPSNFRAQFWLLIAESYTYEGKHSKAERFYQMAVDDATGEPRYEASYLLGKCRIALGNIERARYSFISIEKQSRFAHLALKELLALTYQQQEYDAVLEWIEEARAYHPSEFNDAKSLYYYISSLISLGKFARADTELREFRRLHGDSNNWLSLARAKRIVEFFHTQTK